MKERPILFSAPMVRAILEGRKTQTRRKVKPQPELFADPDSENFGKPWMPIGGFDQSKWKFHYGVPGDRLWVRETFQHCPSCGLRNYAASSPKNCRACDETLGDWKPSIFLPWYSARIILEIEAVRVERLIEITREDAIAEGLEFFDGRPVNHHGWRSDLGGLLWSEPEGAFRELWESINGPGSWDLNPWVWVIQFRRITF